MRKRTRLPERPGFTIVELLVSLALIIFIMYILAEAFAAGSAVFRRLKAIGDMNARLRTASTTMRRVLAADHFEGKKRLSDPGFWTDGPPQQGFFRIWQDAVDPPPLPDVNNPELPAVPEGEDLDGLQSYRSTRHHLHFTTRLRGNNRGDFFQATLPTWQQPTSQPLSPLRLPGPLEYQNWPPGFPRPDSRLQEAGNVYMSPWAEIALYLQPSYIDANRTVQEMTEDPNPPTGGGPLPLYTLYMRQRLLRPLQPVQVPQPQQQPPPPPPPHPNYDVPIEIQIPAPTPPGNPTGPLLVTIRPTQNHELSITRGGTDPLAAAGTNPFYGPDDRETTAGRGNNATSLYMNTPVDVTMPIRRFGWPYWATFPPTTSPATADVPDVAGNRSPGGLPAVTTTNPVIPALPGYPTMADESGDLAGTDVLLTDVISMDIRVLLDDAAYVVTATRTSPPPPGQPATIAVQGLPYFISLHNERYPTAIYQDLVAKWAALTPPGVWGAAPTINYEIIGGTIGGKNVGKYKMDRGPLGQPPLPPMPPLPASVRQARVFDTWSSRKDAKYDYSKWDQTNLPETIPMLTRDGTKFAPIRIRAIQITLRIWDSKTKQSRQVSLIQDM